MDAAMRPYITKYKPRLLTIRTVFSFKPFFADKIGKDGKENITFLSFTLVRVLIKIHLGHIGIEQ